MEVVVEVMAHRVCRLTEITHGQRIVSVCLISNCFSVMGHDGDFGLLNGLEIIRLPP